MKILFLILVLACMAFCCKAQYLTSDHPCFKAVFPLRANGVCIDVNTGHSAPLVYDFNKDGVDDLLVGEFGKEVYPGKSEYSQGRCRIYLNHGTNIMPVYRDYQWLSAGGRPMCVPTTCCICFVPRFADLNGDGLDDLISGSYPGDIYCWEGEAEGQFRKGEILKDAAGKPLHVGYSSIAVDPVDWDNDGDYDLLVSTRGNGFFLCRNEGTPRQCIFRKPEKIRLDENTFLITYLNPHDWDGDGLFDLVGGMEYGDLLWFRNQGTLGSPSFSRCDTLWKNPVREKRTEDVLPLGGRVKLSLYDYDKDGKDDLIVGDVFWTEKELWKLGPKEERRREKLEHKVHTMDQEFYERHPDIWEQVRTGGQDKITDRTYLRFEKYRKEMWDAYKEANRNRLSETHGYVWVFLRK